MRRTQRKRPRFDAIVTIVGSSWVESIQYCTETRTLEAILKPKNGETEGKRYQYPNVTAEAVTKVVFAKSSGSALNKLIKKRTDYKEMRLRRPKSYGPLGSDA